jgi:hypothetical protein
MNNDYDIYNDVIQQIKDLDKQKKILLKDLSKLSMIAQTIFKMHIVIDISNIYKEIRNIENKLANIKIVYDKLEHTRSTLISKIQVLKILNDY